MKRTIYEQQSIDFETGEITSVTTVTASRITKFEQVLKSKKWEFNSSVEGTEFSEEVNTINIETPENATY